MNENPNPSHLHSHVNIIVQVVIICNCNIPGLQYYFHLPLHTHYIPWSSCSR